MSDAETKTVYAAWNAVMRDVQAIGKDGRNKSQGYSFRGIDAVMNAAGPAMREHGVIVIPSLRTAAYRDVEAGSKRTPMREATVQVGYTIIGPQGDGIDFGCVPGEALDSGDKATAKAMSVAYRIFLLQALTIPTDETDPDEHSYERASRDTVPSVPAKDAQDKVLAAAEGDTAIAGQAWRHADLGDRQNIPQNLLEEAVAAAQRLVVEAAPEQPELLPDNGHKATDEARQKMQPKGEES